MTQGCVAYVLTDNETASNQAAILVNGLNQLGGFAVTVQDVVLDPNGMVDLATGPSGPRKLKPYHTGGFSSSFASLPEQTASGRPGALAVGCRRAAGPSS